MQVLSGDDTFGNALVAFGAPFQDHEARATDGEPFPASSSCRRDSWIPTLALDRHATWQKLADDGPGPRARRQLVASRTRSSSTRTSGACRRRTCSIARSRCAERLDEQRDNGLERQFKRKTVLVVGQRAVHAGRLRSRRRRSRVSRRTRGGRWPRDARQARACPACARGRSIASTAACRRSETRFAAYLELLVKGSTLLLPPLGDAAPTRGTARRRSCPQSTFPCPPAKPAAGIRARISWRQTMRRRPPLARRPEPR